MDNQAWQDGDLVADGMNGPMIMVNDTTGPAPYPIRDMLQAAGVGDGLVKYLKGKGALVIATATAAAKMQNDAELLKYAKAIANNDLEAIRGHYVIWIIGDQEWRGEIVDAYERRVEFGEKGEQLDVTNLLDSTSHIVIIAATQQEAETRLEAMKSAT